MVSNIYTQYNANRPSKVVKRTKKQGAPRKPVEMRKLRKNMTFTPSGYTIAKKKAMELGMSVSAFYELAGVLYEIDVYNNCSKH